jgi:hypothetical protein
VRITVGIGARLFESTDGGRNWTSGARVVPLESEPRTRGLAAGLDLPLVTGWTTSDVHIGPEGVGLAVGTEPVRGERGERSSNARFLRTIDAGVTWHAIQPDIGRWGRMRAWPSWPPEAVDSIAVLAGGVMAFAWEDPWLYEGPHCHIALSGDGGARWRYARLPDGCNALACGPGPLRVFSGGRVAVRSDLGSFRRETSRLDWNRPPGYGDHPLPVRLPQFTSEAEGLAIVVSWPREEPPRTREELPPPVVGLARSGDGGRRWRVVSTWEGPRFTDLNRRHQLALEVR